MFGFGKPKNKLSPSEAKSQLDSGENIIIIDVRNAAEFKQGHIENAINIPMDIVSNEIEKAVPNKDQKIFVNCLSGGRSKASCSLIEAKGYTNVFDIGGVNSWSYGLVK